MNLLFTLLLYVIVLGLLYWLVTAVIPLPPVMRTVAQVIFVIIVLVIVFDLLSGGSIGLPALR